MSEAKEKKEIKQYNVITERFCSKLGENAIIVTTQTASGEEHKCLCAQRCKAECEHRK